MSQPQATLQVRPRTRRASGIVCIVWSEQPARAAVRAVDREGVRRLLQPRACTCRDRFATIASALLCAFALSRAAEEARSPLKERRTRCRFLLARTRELLGRFVGIGSAIETGALVAPQLRRSKRRPHLRERSTAAAHRPYLLGVASSGQRLLRGKTLPLQTREQPSIATTS